MLHLFSYFVQGTVDALPSYNLTIGRRPNNYSIYKKIKLYANHGLENRNNAKFFGVNSRLDALQASVIDHRLNTLDKVIKKRRLRVFQKRMQKKK